MASSPAQDIFNDARKEFLNGLAEGASHEISQFTSIDQVYQAADQIQELQSQTGTIRNLRRIQPFLECMQQYEEVVGIFVQVKPEILGLIWGPIRMLLLVSSTYIKSYDRLLDVLARIGDSLPQFQKYADIFQKNGTITQILVLFYKDILAFYAILVDFFRLKKWRVFFESLWPRYLGKVSVVTSSIERHRALLYGEVTLADISEAHAARTRAEQEYERTHEAEQRQKFEVAKASISPQLYDFELENLGRRRSIDTGQWLEHHGLFQKWIDPADSSTRLLWLEGIPGAGKTFLTSAVIDRIRPLGPPFMFAFLRYQSSQATCTLKILHSLMFQLVLDKRALRPILTHAYDNDYRQLLSSVEYNQTLLEHLLQGSGPTRIAVDGLDELRELERTYLLPCLLKLHQRCPELKLLFSSRAEHDISKCLKPQVSPIRVHLHNELDINVYVRMRLDSWLSSFDVDSSTATEIRRLVEPIKAKAEGMFLYVRLVLDNLTSQISIEAIREEAENLPDGLDQAYGRIVTRLNRDLSPQQLVEAKTIFEWVGCAAFPLRAGQIELALAINRSSETFFDNRTLFLNIVQRCGPIVEYVDETVRFVHFTAWEYLFGPQSNHFLDVTSSHQNLASTCIKYLLSSCFNPAGSDEEISKYILIGAYKLEEYASWEWLGHVKKCAKNSTPGSSKSHELCCSLEDFVSLRANPNFIGITGRNRAATEGFDMLVAGFPEVHTKLLDANAFFDRWENNASLEEDERFNHDPFITSHMSLRIRRLLECMVCPSLIHHKDCKCAMLQEQYGTSLFKCNHLRCKFFRAGFDTKAKRDDHLNSHRRPFKCPHTHCDFATIGFRTQALCNNHTSQAHRDRSPPIFIDTDSFKHGEETLSILIDAVKADELDYVRALRAHVSGHLGQLCELAIKFSSISMLELLLEESDDVNEITNPQPLFVAVRCRDYEAARLLLDRGADINAPCDEKVTPYPDNSRLLDFATGSAKMTEFLLDHGADVNLKEKNLCAVVASKCDRESDEETIRLLQILSIQTKEPKALEVAFKVVAERSCSIEVAKFLLQKGVDVNTRGARDYPSIATALYIASRKTTREAAELAKFLLESGADPDIEVGGRKVRDQRGAKNIHRWLGVSWDELVETTRATTLRFNS